MSSPHSSLLAEAVKRLLVHDWRAAHALVQELDDPIAWWIHGLVHRIEGDLSNSRYWYEKAGVMPETARSVEDEIRDIGDRLAAVAE